MGCVAFGLFIGIVGFDMTIFEMYGLWGLIPLAFELALAWLIALVA